MRKLANDAAAEQQHAHDKDHALDDEDPLADRGQVVLKRDHEEGAHGRPEHAALAAIAEGESVAAITAT